MTGTDSPRGPVRTALRTAGMLALLQAALPLNLAVTSAALVRSAVRGRPQPAVADRPRTVLVSGGKMTKALQLARSFHAAGHRVVLVESATYRLTGHRFSRAVSAFHVVPAPDEPGYAEALRDVVLAEGVDVYVPVCSPVASLWDARAAALLAGHCEVLHLSPEQVEQLDDKAAFAGLVASLGLGVPDTHRVTSPEQAARLAEECAAAHPGRSYVLKSIAYDPVHRLDLTPLPRPTHAETLAFAAARPITPDNPWILQEFVAGQEFCTHSTVRDGQVRVYCCSRSSAFQVNYAMVDEPAIEEWVTAFCAATGVTGQVSFDVMLTPAGEVAAIECNPRTHSAITEFHDHPGLAAGYLDPAPAGAPAVRPLPGSRPTHWTYHEAWRLLTEPDRVARLRAIAVGTDAVYDADDPLPFLLVHHLQLPSLLLRNLVRGKDWIRIDCNIGKLVQAAGD